MSDELDGLPEEVREAVSRHSLYMDFPAADVTERAVWNAIRAEMIRLADFERIAVRENANAREWRARAERAESDLAELRAKVDGYVVTLADKTHPSGLRYVMAYHDRETAEVLLARDKAAGRNHGQSIRAFRLID